MKSSLAVFFGCAVLCSTPVWAVQGKGPKTFEALDANNDKALSKEEVASARRLSSEFDRVDTDRNGSLSKEEVQTFRAEKRAAQLSK